MTSFTRREVVATYKLMSRSSSRNESPVIGSSDSCTVLCLAPLSWIKSPLMTVTAPFPNPTANCERSSIAVNADI
ncbi:hypothetical protein EYC84_009784 [Monilinia fructicola]|uniref:Uncharacterized protein n=1 Tax=Monilinia fructicola TaxID=38448 RepID=A0A5M9JDS6_MONFR|nr:hypothetical protein EYC84_009784 [Monilinia fructicola]